MKLVASLLVAFIVSGCILDGAGALAGSVVVPVGLTAGDQYYLAFVTAGTRDATSSNIADYNQFVQSQAALNPALTGTNMGVQWLAVASTQVGTQGTNAEDNLGLDPRFPIYLLDGTTLVEQHASDLWVIGPQIPIDEDQYANLVPSAGPGEFVWTGTTNQGETAFPNQLGSAMPAFGWTPRGPEYWVDTDSMTSAAQLPMYAVSQLLTVPTSTPEPSSLALAAFGFAGFLVWGCAAAVVEPESANGLFRPWLPKHAALA